ncbi:MAG: DUF1145 domain-containing protein [Planctomycetota bacterium]|nr:DUF1145 domain-containing protein [Planctomycetota bacterium]
MNGVGKLGVTLFWIVVLGAAFQLFAEAWTQPILIAGLVLTLLHVGELALFQKQIKKYPGPYWQSVALTLIFGILHWKGPWEKPTNQG